MSYYLDNDEYSPTPNNFFPVEWNGNAIAALTLTNAAHFDYMLFQTTQVATAASTTLTFTGQHVNAWYVLDDISVNQSAVPLPGAILLLGSGLLGLVGFRRFKKS